MSICIPWVWTGRGLIIGMKLCLHGRLAGATEADLAIYQLLVPQPSVGATLRMQGVYGLFAGETEYDPYGRPRHTVDTGLDPCPLPRYSSATG